MLSTEARYGGECNPRGRPRRRPLLNHLIGSSQQRFRDGKAERLCGLEVDGQFELGGLLHRQIGRFFASENAPGIDARLVRLYSQGCSHSYQTAGHMLGVFAEFEGPAPEVRMVESRPPVAAAAICFCFAANAWGELKSGTGGGLTGSAEAEAGLEQYCH
jgi:hypothetical protein